MSTHKFLNTIFLTAALVFALGETAAAAQAGGGKPQTAQAIFAGGCFWSVERFFDKVEGVVATVSGFAGGTKKSPTYDEVVTGRTGHAESVQVTYDPKKVSYEKLLDAFWHNIDPFTPNGQFCDFGTQYRTVIFYQGEEQKRLAEKSKADLQGRFKKPVATEIVAAPEFYPAEEYHQDFHIKNPAHYERYRIGCGRDRQLAKIWGEQKK
jgi:peptide-methionine (S)-S-oxide reductase